MEVRDKFRWIFFKAESKFINVESPLNRMGMQGAEQGGMVGGRNAKSRKVGQDRFKNDARSGDQDDVVLYFPSSVAESANKFKMLFFFTVVS